MKKYLNPLLLLAAAMIWGFAFAAQDAASEVPAFTLGFGRSLLAVLFLIPTVAVLDRVNRTGRRLIGRRGIDLNRYELVGGILLGVILAAASALQQFGINAGTDGGKAAFITALYVVMVPIYALVLKKRAPLNVWISVAIAVVGFYLLCIEDGLTVQPSDMLVVGCALVFPIHILIIDHLSPKCDGVRMSLVQFASCTAVNLILAILTEGNGFSLAPLAVSILPVLYLGIGSSGVAYTLQIVGQRGVNPGAASIILSLESVFGVIGTALFIGSTLSGREYLGCLIVLFAVILCQLNFNNKKDSTKGESQNA